MSTDVIDEVRLLAPPFEPTSELERARQRQKLTDSIAAESGVSSGGKVPLRRRKRRLARGGVSRRRAYLAAAAALLVAAAATAIPLSLGGGTSSAAPVIQLASYRLRLPANYRLTAAITSDCHPYLLFKPPTNPWDGKMPGASSYASQVASAAGTAGGCVFMALLPAYTPTAATPDPEQAVLSGAEQVQVGPYQAWVGTTDATEGPADGYAIIKSGPTQDLGDETMLYVEIPLNGGQTQDLVVGSSSLSQSQLVSLVANGLSAVVGNSGTGNTGTAGTSGANAS
jgi:hypothetical protein